jgi:hypothetical protein
MEFSKALEYYSEEVAIEQPGQGIGVELEIDIKTAQKSMNFYLIKNGQKTPVAESQVMKSKVYNQFEKALQAISNSNNRRKFAPEDPRVVDIVATQTEPNKWVMRATSDDGQLQLSWDFGTKAWKPVKLKGK